MVGPPKNLYDLRKLDADIRIVCRACGRRRMVDREWLIAELTQRGKSVDWTMVAQHLRCAVDGCGARDTRLEVEPFAGRDNPPVVQALLDALAAYIVAHGGLRADPKSLRLVGQAGGELHRATRRLVMWAKYGIEPERK